MILFPNLCNQLGNNKEHVRTMLNELMMSAANLYPVKDLFGFLQAGLKSKNGRSRLACLEVMLTLIETAGSIKTACNPKQFMPILAEVLKSDRDRSVVSGALSIICKCFEELGD